MKARLAMYKDGKLEVAFSLPEPGATIGRDAENHIQLNDPRVSRRHAVVDAQHDMWVVKDKTSTNGILVNGARVKHAVLRPGDQLGIGPFALVFEAIPDSEQWEPPHDPEPNSEVRRPTVSEQREPGGPDTVPG